MIRTNLPLVRLSAKSKFAAAWIVLWCSIGRSTSQARGIAMSQVVIVDNILHILINGAAITYIG